MIHLACDRFATLARELFDLDLADGPCYCPRQLAILGGDPDPDRRGLRGECRYRFRARHAGVVLDLDCRRWDEVAVALAREIGHEFVTAADERLLARELCERLAAYLDAEPDSPGAAFVTTLCAGVDPVEVGPCK